MGRADEQLKRDIVEHLSWDSRIDVRLMKPPEHEIRSKALKVLVGPPSLNMEDVTLPVEIKKVTPAGIVPIWAACHPTFPQTADKIPNRPHLRGEPGMIVKINCEKYPYPRF